jgi:cyanophycin synthetase
MLAAMQPLRSATPIPGFVNGLCHPSLLLELVVRLPEQENWLPNVNSVLVTAFSSPAFTPDALPAIQSTKTEKTALHLMLFWAHQLQRAAGLPIFEQGKIVGNNAKKRSYLLAVPSLSQGHRATDTALAWILELFNVIAAEGNVSELHKVLPDVVASLSRTGPTLSNISRFRRAAYDIGAPVSDIPGNVIQIGYGARSRWLDSSFTDETPFIAAKLARSKTLTAETLRQAGIPVPAHISVKGIDEALAAAKSLGYPVVVKPENLDGGIGVVANVLTPEELTEAYQSTKQYSSNVLIEKHVDGRDYRLMVFQGNLIWAVERRPGGVTGDGKSTVKILVDQLNADPRRGDGGNTPLKRLDINGEAQKLLQHAGLDLNSVPKSGTFVRLRSTANLASGGTPIAVFDQVHPDNRLLAIRAAETLKLDLAGIDLLIPDIRHSWLETGAAICEVNSQPNLGQVTTSHLYVPILQKLVEGNGRIPIVVIVGAFPENHFAKNIVHQLKVKGLPAGLANGNSVSIDDATVVNTPRNVYDSGRILMLDKHVKAAVVCINDVRALRNGLPFDRFDVLVIAGNHLAIPSASEKQTADMSQVALRRVVDALIPACQSKVFVVDKLSAEPRPNFESSKAMFINDLQDEQEITSAVVQELIKADERHRVGNTLVRVHKTVKPEMPKVKTNIPAKRKSTRKPK